MANFHHGINHWIILGIIATPNLTDSAVGESNLASLSGDCVITSFPHHEVVKLTEETLPPPARFFHSTDGSLVSNSSA